MVHPKRLSILLVSLALLSLTLVVPQASTSAVSTVVNTPTDISGPSLAILTGVSCVDATDCTAVGQDYGNTEPAYDIETNGVWAAGVDVNTLNNPAQFNGISCTSVGNCVAVGYYISATNPFYVVEANGVWGSPVQLSFDGDFLAVSCADAGDCLVVGEDLNLIQPISLAESGGTWGTIQDVSADGLFYGVSCFDNTHCTAVGQNQSNDAPNFDDYTSGGWSLATDLSSPNGPGQLNAISCTAATTCVAVGTDVLGKPFADAEITGTWSTSVSLSSSTAAMNGVSCFDGTHCTAVGNETGGQPTYATETSGTWAALTDISLPGGSGAFTGVSCSATNNCTAVGQGQGNSGGFYDTESTGTWENPTDIQVPTNSGAFSGVACTGATTCMAVGGDTLSTGQPLEASEITGSWSNPLDLSGVQTVSFLDSVSCTDTSDCTAVGEDDANAEPIFATYSSGSWTSYQDMTNPPPGGNGYLYSVSCYGVGDCTAVGEDSGNEIPFYINETSGIWDPSGGTDVSLPNSGGGYFTSVSCTDASDCTAVGFDFNNDVPFAVTESGGTWGTPVDMTTTLGYGAFTSVSCTSAGNCTAVGVDSASNASSNFNVPRFPSPVPFYATEVSGVWQVPVDVTLPASGNGYFRGISCASAGNCTAVGAYESLNEPFYITETANTWNSVVIVPSPNTAGQFTSVSCVDAADCTAVGVDLGTSNPTPLFDYLGPVPIVVPFTPTTTTSTTSTTTSTTTTTAVPTTTTTIAVPPSAPKAESVTLRFQTAVFVLNASQQNFLTKFIDSVVRRHARSITVVGFASPPGTINENGFLSRARAAFTAQFVRLLLKEFHVATVKVSIRSGGIMKLPNQFADQIAIVTVSFV